MNSRALLLAIIILTAALGVALSGGLGGQPPARPPLVKLPDGRSLYVKTHGAFKAYYDVWGRLDFVEHDSNGDGLPDRIARHNGAKRPFRIEVDADFDGRPDRWEDFDEAGHLTRFGLVGEDGRAHRFTGLDAEGRAVRYEYDEDGNGLTERTEVIEDGRVAKVLLDTDDDTRFDRWQEWKNGRLATETIDIDGDGTADRRLVYGAGGSVRLERLGP
jgi:hypothetical protein